MASPLVSVIVLTYNHSDFIEQCLSSVLDQETDFLVEIIVSDDASVDATPNKVKKIHAKVGSLKFNENEKNVGVGKNFQSALNLCRGEYIAFCEGDDFWCDPKKLTKQIELLKKDSSSSFVYGNYGKVDIDGKLIDKEVLTPTKLSFGMHDFIEGHGPTTHSIVVKRSIFPQRLPKAFFRVHNPDVFIIGWALAVGRGAYIPETMSMYRVHEGGIYGSISRTEKKLLRYATRMEFFGTMPLSYRSYYSLAMLKLEETLARAKRSAENRLFAKYIKKLPIGRRIIFSLKQKYYKLKMKDR